MSTDPTIVGTCVRSRRWIRLAAQRGLSITRVAGSPTAVRLIGPGVHVVAAELRLLVEDDFVLPRLRLDAQQ